MPDSPSPLLLLSISFQNREALGNSVLEMKFECCFVLHHLNHTCLCVGLQTIQCLPLKRKESKYLSLLLFFALVLHNRDASHHIVEEPLFHEQVSHLLGLVFLNANLGSKLETEECFLGDF